MTLGALPNAELDGTFEEIAPCHNLPRYGDPDGLSGCRTYVWGEGQGARQFLIEGPPGNKTIHLIAQFYFRYDPPRTAAGGTGQEPLADYHLFDRLVTLSRFPASDPAMPNLASRFLFASQMYELYRAACALASGGSLLSAVNSYSGIHCSLARCP